MQIVRRSKTKPLHLAVKQNHKFWLFCVKQRMRHCEELLLKYMQEKEWRNQSKDAITRR